VPPDDASWNAYHGNRTYDRYEGDSDHQRSDETKLPRQQTWPGDQPEETEEQLDAPVETFEGEEDPPQPVHYRARTDDGRGEACRCQRQRKVRGWDGKRCDGSPLRDEGHSPYR
jgi:hypothetical protein